MSRSATGPARPGPAAVVGAFALDAVLVVTFAAIGRASHEEDVLGPGAAGLAVTAWPFLAALALGWIATFAWRAPAAPTRTGVPVWAITVAGAMALRALSGQGVAIAFVIVAAISLLVLLVGWRALATWIARRRAHAA